jgi:dethiobiotin synthetase
MSYFITGTDTDVGKTLISCALLHGMARLGQRVIAMKPVACDDGFESEDVKLLIASGNVPCTSVQINPYFFKQAVAPHLAARQAGVSIDLERIASAYRELASMADQVIVEGAGGFFVPLNESHSSADLVALLNLPVILVVGIRLGCLNHALLTQLAIEATGVRLTGWVANCVDNEMRMADENIAALTRLIRAPRLGIVPYFTKTPDAREVAGLLDLSLLQD